MTRCYPAAFVEVMRIELTAVALQVQLAPLDMHPRKFKKPVER